MQVFVNGRERTINSAVVTQEKLALIEGLPVGPVYSVTYRNGQRKGILAAGDWVHATEGMVFNIAHTGDA